MNYWNSNQISKVGKEVTAELFNSQVRYMDKNGEWLPIDCVVVEKGSVFEVTKAPFKCTLPLYSDGEACFENNNRHDKFLNKRITCAPLVMTIRNPTADHVRGELFDIAGDGRMDSVRYPLAFPSIGADLLFNVHHGRSPKLEHIAYWSPENLPFTEVETQGAFKWFDGTSNRIEISPLVIPSRITGDWRRKKYRDECELNLKSPSFLLDQNKGLYIRAFNQDQKRGSAFGSIKAWYYDLDGEKVSYNINATINREEIGSDWYILTKTVPSFIFDEARSLGVGVFTDATIEINPDPHPETTSADGWILNNQPLGTTWDTLRNAATGTSASDTSAALVARLKSHSTTNEWEHFYRSGLSFDPSALPGSAVISDADLYLTPRSAVDNFDQSCCIVDSSPASDTAIVVGDYDQINDVEQSDTRIHFGDSVVDVPDVFPLNAAAIAGISSADLIRLGLRASGDLDDIEPTWASLLTARVHHNSADVAVQAKKPKLTITYIEAGAGLQILRRRRED